VLVLFPLGVAAKLWSLSRKRYRVHKVGTIVVSGCSTGIGRHAALTLAKLGYKVLAGVRSAADARALEAEAAAGSDLQAVTLDVTVPLDVEAVARIARESGPVVGLVNNAGVSLGFVIEAMDEEEMRAVFEVNVFGALRLTKALIPLLRESQGRIVNVTSVEGLYARAGKALYGASKYALEGVSDALRRELDCFGVSVSAVEPGAVASEMLYHKGPTGRERHYEVPVVQEHYQPLVQRRRNEAKLGELARAGIVKVPEPDVTSDAIVHALSSPYPRARYPVSTLFFCSTATLARLLWLLPTRVMDGQGGRL